MDPAATDSRLALALDQQAVTAEILRVIAGSSADDATIFKLIVTHAARLCDAHFAFVTLNQGDRLALVERTDCTPEFAAYLERGLPLDRGTVTGRSALEQKSVQVLDFFSDPQLEPSAAHYIESVRAVLAVPMCHDGRLLGVISIWRREKRAFSQSQVRMLEIFGAQVAIALQRSRLVRQLELRNAALDSALEQQTATAEILRVISRSPTDALPVFDTIVRSAVRLCGSLFANVFRYDGEVLHFIASHNTGRKYDALMRSKYPMRPDRSQVSGRVVLARAIVRLENARADPDYDQRFPTEIGWRRVLGVPLLRDGEVLGVIVVGWEQAGPVPAEQEELLRTFAEQALIAIENVRLFDELRRKSRQLELASTYKSRFLAAASHDLRQPLSALNLFVAQLRDEPNPDERNRLVAQIEASVGAMNELFSSLLDMSKLEAGMLQANLTSFPVAKLFADVERTLAAEARAKGLRLRLLGGEATIRSDYVLLERVLLNLVANAVRYTRRGGVLVGCRRRGQRLLLQIWDSGPGIPEDRQQDVFHEFYRLESAHAGASGGLGLGLAIVERLCLLLDHPVSLQSRLGKGSCFSVSVPIAGMPPSVIEAGPAEAHAAADPVPGKLIVVIDDEPLVLDSMRGVLLSWGCKVVAASSPGDALSELQKRAEQPDAIISDYRLGDGISGIQAIERLRSALREDVPAFLVSGDTAPERLRDAASGGYHLLHKPVLPLALRAMLNRLLTAQATRARPPRAATKGG